MPRPGLLSRGSTWDTAELKLLGGDGDDHKGRRRRLLNRITRFASSPTLTSSSSRAAEQSSAAPQEVSKTKQSVSCISLSVSRGGGTAPFVLDSGTESSLDLFVDCDDGTGTATKEPQLKKGPVWADLPVEVKVNILGYCEPRALVRMSAVSQEFRRLCFDGQLWSTLDASEFYNRIPVAQLAQLIVSAGNFVRHLNLRGCVQLQRDWRVEAVANACRNLISASLEGCKFERSIVHFIIIRNPQLVHVNISGLPTITNSTFRMLAASCPQIRTLNVSFCTGADGRGLRRVVDHCKNLRELKACELNLTDMGLMQALFKANMVEKLHLGDTIGVTDEHIRLLVEGVDPDIDPFTDRSTAPARKLTHLDLGRCNLLTDSALRHLSDNIPNMERLELGGIVSLSDAALAELLPTMPRLTHLDLEECLELTNTTLINIARSPAANMFMHLRVSYCENMGDVGVMELLRRCHRLWNLEMDNTRVSDLTLAEAARVVAKRPACRLVNSRFTSHVALRLVVFDCPNITWTGVREVLSRNTEYMKTDTATPGLILLKCYYEYQKTVDEHTKLVMRRDIEKADRLEACWAEYMMASEEASAGDGRRRGRRRDANGWDDNSRRRGRGVICTIM